MAHACDFIFYGGFDAIAQPRVGSVIVTEIMSNPTAVADTAGEWFELTHVGAGTVELGGCTVGNGSIDVALPAQTAGACWTGVVARSMDPVANGGVDSFASFGFALPATGSLNLTCAGQLIDSTSWSSETEGRSRSLDPGRYSAQLNDVDANWCPATAPYNDTDDGSPGSSNELCPTPGPVAPPPGPGEVLINELMQNPELLSDTAAEWIELRSLADGARDLYGCVFNNGSADSAAYASLELASGGYALLAHTSDAEQNGGLTVDATFSFALTNSGTLALKCGGVVIDTIAWASSTSGRSLQRDPVTPATLCTAPASVAEYTASNYGTPRFENASCN
jgi:hypothetical protein